MINANQDWYPHVFIPQTDIFKQLKPYSNVDNIFVSSKRELLNSMGMYPDLTIHKSQDNNAKENQLLALECKISPNLSFLEFAIDVLKLHIYADALKYQNIVYVLINVELDDIVLYIQQYNDKYWRNRDKEICYIIKNGFGGEIFVLNGET